MRKHIHVITKYFYPVAAGIETNILETYASIADTWNITIHTTRDEYLRKNSLPKKETMRDMAIQRYNFHSEFIGFTPDINYDTADVVALHNFNVFFFWMFLKAAWHKLTRTKKYTLVVTPHGGFCPEWSMFPFVMRWVKYLYHASFGVLFLNTVVDVIRAVSEWEKNEMIKLGVKANKITVIPNGLENEAFMNVDKLASTQARKLVKQAGDYIIQIGRIYPIKNYETVIRALAHVPKIRYVIVGQVEKSIQYKDYKSHLDELAKKLGVSDRIIYAGVIRGVDKYYVLKHAKMMVHMAIWESFCNVVHEALSQGLVCIVANNTALPLLIKDQKNGFCVETYDSVKLANRIQYVLDNEKSAKIQTMKKVNRQIGKRDSWRNVGRTMYALYTRGNV
jgi:glycosyltransferase involved in cell wall biosynthesis